MGRIGIIKLQNRPETGLLRGDFWLSLFVGAHFVRDAFAGLSPIKKPPNKSLLRVLFKLGSRDATER
jgi:hypothetical protein